jgi:acyl-CoA oxidase
LVFFRNLAEFFNFLKIKFKGDNRVIQQKVSKELLDLVMSDFEAVGIHMQLRNEPIEAQHAAFHVAGDDVSSSDWQIKLFKKRESFTLNELASRMFIARQNGAPIFDTWMLQESDNVQALATAYGENMTVEQFNKAIQSAKPELKPVLQKLFSLYSLDRIIADGVFFLQNGLINAKQSEAISVEIKRLCHELGDHMPELTSAFGIPDHVSYYFQLLIINLNLNLLN